MAAAAVLLLRQVLAADHGAVPAEVVKRHAEGVQGFRESVTQPSIAAENRGVAEGCQVRSSLYPSPIRKRGPLGIGRFEVPLLVGVTPVETERITRAK